MQRKYPYSMFFGGIMINLIRFRFILLPALILFIGWIATPYIQGEWVIIALIIPFMWSVIYQYIIVKNCLEMLPGDEGIDAMFADNGRVYKNIIDVTQDIIAGRRPIIHGTPQDTEQDEKNKNDKHDEE